MIGNRQASEFAIGTLLRGLRFVTHSRLSDAIVRLRHAAPVDAALAEKTSSTPRSKWTRERDAIIPSVQVADSFVISLIC